MSIIRLIVGQGMRLALVGVAVGLVAAFFLSRFLSGTLYAVSPNDPLTYAAVSLLLMTTVAGSCLVLALKAAKRCQA